jgi:hypothetical protein
MQAMMKGLPVLFVGRLLFKQVAEPKTQVLSKGKQGGILRVPN